VVRRRRAVRPPTRRAGWRPDAPSKVRGVSAPSLDGRWFGPVGDAEGGGVDPETVFRFSEEGGEVWGLYTGGAVRRGHLVGTREGDRVEFRYVQLDASGETSCGHCVSAVTVLGDGRLRLDGTWEWESREGAGRSVVEELPADSAAAG
jgi:hypothetical protein